MDDLIFYDPTDNLLVVVNELYKLTVPDDCSNWKYFLKTMVATGLYSLDAGERSGVIPGKKLEKFIFDKKLIYIGELMFPVGVDHAD